MQIHVCNDLLFGKCKLENRCNLNHDVTTKHSMSIWHRYNMSEEEMNSSNENSILASIMPAIPASPPRQDNIPIGGTQADVASAMSSCSLNKSPAIQWGDTSMEMQAIKPQANSSTIPKKRTSPGSPNLRGVHYSPVNIESAQIDAAATEPASMRGHLPHYQGHVAAVQTAGTWKWRRLRVLLWGNQKVQFYRIPLDWLPRWRSGVDRECLLQAKTILYFP